MQVPFDYRNSSFYLRPNNVRCYWMSNVCTSLVWGPQLSVYLVYSWLCAQGSLLVRLQRTHTEPGSNLRWGACKTNTLPTVLSLWSSNAHTFIGLITTSKTRPSQVRNSSLLGCLSLTFRQNHILVGSSNWCLKYELGSTC